MISLFLYESPIGYALFEEVKSDEAPDNIQQLEQYTQNFESFSKIIKIKSFRPFQGNEQALENSIALIEGQMSEYLKNFLDTTLAGAGASIISLGVADQALASKINEQFGIQVKADEFSLEIIRGIRKYFNEFKEKEDFQAAKIEDLKNSLSKTQITTEVPKADQMIQQSVSLLEQLDKESNTFCMRIKEWYGWHFPELAKMASNNISYIKLVKLIQDRTKIEKDIAPKIEEIVLDEGQTQYIIQMAECSMGCEISQEDMNSIVDLCDRSLSLLEYQDQLKKYIEEKMEKVAPNLTALVGANVGAKLISHAGTLENLAKIPASTVQILGAEKALFRALKAKGNTPKYGLIYHQQLVSNNVETKSKGKISRYLANKMVIAKSAQLDHAELFEQIESNDKDQILEAEKTLFKGLKNSEEAGAPKSGLVFHNDNYKPPEKKDQNS